MSRLVTRILCVVPQLVMLAAMLWQPAYRKGLGIFALTMDDPIRSMISLLVFAVVVVISTPLLIKGWGDMDSPERAWVGALSALVIYAFEFGVPPSWQRWVLALILSMIASAIGFRLFLRSGILKTIRF